MEIRKLLPEEWDQAAALVWQVFRRFEVAVYSPERVNSFVKLLDDRETLRRLDIWNAWEQTELLGILASQNDGGHICLLLVWKSATGKAWAAPCGTV